MHCSIGCKGGLQTGEQIYLNKIKKLYTIIDYTYYDKYEVSLLLVSDGVKYSCNRRLKEIHCKECKRTQDF